ncbi:unnamed protein product [Closterium sp. NIES-53]
MAKATFGRYPEVDVARHAQAKANGCAAVQVGPIICVHLRACTLLSSTGQRWTAALLQRWHTVDLLCWQVAFLQCWRGSSTQRWHAVDHAVLSVDQASCRVASPTWYESLQGKINYKTPRTAQGMATQKERSSSNGSPGTTPTPPPTSSLQTAEGTATRPATKSTETLANQTTGLDPSMMEKFFSFMSFYEQHQQAAPAQSNNSDNNNGVTPMSLDGSSYA